MAWLIGSMRRLREAQSHTLALAAIIVMASFAAVAGPRFVSGTQDDLLHETLASARAEVRDLTFTEEWRIRGTEGAPFADVDAAGAHVMADIPPAVASVLAPPVRVVDTPRWIIVDNQPPETTIRLRFHEGAEAHVRMTQGRQPTAATVTMPRTDDPTGQEPPVAVFEIALSEASAVALGAAIGDRVILALDRSDRLSTRQVDIRVQYDNRNNSRVGVEVVGIFAVDDPDERFWFDDPALERPIIRSLGGDTRFQDLTVLLADAAYPAYVRATEEGGVPIRYTWRLPVVENRIASTDVGQLIEDLRRLEAIFPTSGVPLNMPDAASLRTGLLPRLEGFVAGWQAIISVLAIVLVGAAAIAAAAVALTVLLVVGRRRASIDLYRSRGASGRQILGTSAAEALIVGVPAAGAGALLAVAAFPNGPTPLLGAGLVVGATTLAFVVAGRPSAQAPGRRAAGQPRIVRPRRMAAEVGLVVIATIAVYLARERGIQAVSAARTLEAADPLVAAAPALAGLAIGVVAQRLFPIPTRLLAWLASHRRDLLPSLAMRRLARGSASGSVLIVLLAGAALATFSSSALVRVSGLASAVAAAEVGAPYRIEGPEGPFPDGFDPKTLPQVTAAALAHVGTGNLSNGTPVGVLAVDPQDLAAVLPDTETGGIPREFVGDPPGREIPVLVSASLGERPNGLDVGDTFSLTVAGYAATFRVIGIRDHFPSMGDRDRFVVMSDAQVRAVVAGVRMSPNRAFLQAPAGIAAELRAAIATSDSRATLLSRDEIGQAIREGPAVVALTSGIAGAAVLAALFAAAAVTVALVLSGAGQAAEIAQLRAVGLARRQAVGLLVLEQAPTVLIALGGGAALGFGLFLALLPGLSLDTIVGGRVEIPFTIDVGHLALTFVAAVVVVGAGLTAAALIQRRATPAAAVRQAVGG